MWSWISLNAKHWKFIIAVSFLTSFYNRAWLVWFMVFNATFSNILVISWLSILLVEETGVPGENHWPAASHWQILSHNVVSNTPCHEQGSFKLTLVVIGTDCTGSCKSNYHMIRTMMASVIFVWSWTSLNAKIAVYILDLLFIIWNIFFQGTYKRSGDTKISERNTSFQFEKTSYGTTY